MVICYCKKIAIQRTAWTDEKAPVCKATWSGGKNFSVTSSVGGFEVVVDMYERNCACRKWQLTGIPCMHAVACYNARGLNPEDGIHPTFMKSMYENLYSHLVEPINGKEFWIPTGYPAPLPPNKKVAPGRPKNKRSKKTDIPKDAEVLPRQNTTVRCGKCKAWGHNVITCPEARSDQNKEQPTAEPTVENEVPSEGRNEVTNEGQDGLFDVPLSGPNGLSSQLPIDTTQLPQWEDIMRESQPVTSSFPPQSQSTVIDESQGGILFSASQAGGSRGGLADKGKTKKTNSATIGTLSKNQRKKLLKPWRP